tara:strand:- start:52375 stop:52776 length:402 start_codon:yes stop_codon:yes gene_type:complete
MFTNKYVLLNTALIFVLTPFLFIGFSYLEPMMPENLAQVMVNNVHYVSLSLLAVSIVLFWKIRQKALFKLIDLIAVCLLLPWCVFYLMPVIGAYLPFVGNAMVGYSVMAVIGLFVAYVLSCFLQVFKVNLWGE